MKTANAAATLASVVFLKIQEFARRPVQEQARLRAQLAALAGDKKKLAEKLDGARVRLETLLKQIPD